MTNPFSVEGRVILVTGGTGHLGSAICKGLSALGARVWCIGRDLGKFGQFDGLDIECRQADVTFVSAMKPLIAEILQADGRIDGLVNNAAHQARRGIDLAMPPGEIDAGLRQCFTHALTTAQLVIPAMKARGRGAIVNTASLWADLAPDPSMYLDLGNEPAVYAPPAKAAILGLTRMLASYLAKDGIRVNAISPGLFPAKRGPERPDYMAEMTRRIPMGRIGQPSELIGAFAYLLSDASSYVTGQNLIVDGGYSIR